MSAEKEAVLLEAIVQSSPFPSFSLSLSLQLSLSPPLSLSLSLSPSIGLHEVSKSHPYIFEVVAV